MSSCTSTGSVKVNSAPVPGPSLSAQTRPPRGLNNPLANGQAKARAAYDASALRRTEAGELPEQVGDQVQGETSSFVFHRDRDEESVPRCLHPNGRALR